MNTQSSRRNNFFLILILGALTTISPFAIDFYLPAFSQMAVALNTNVTTIALSLSSYFVGLAIGQIAYGPLLDRFGRKKPLYIGLIIFILASLACAQSQTVETLIAFRFLQALGGCAAQVAAMAMVRDFFPVKEGAKVFSLLMLVLGTSPLLAPTLGSFISTTFGWQAVFIALAAIVCTILMVIYFYLPEGHQPDPNISLNFKPIVKNFLQILKEPQFYTYALSGAFAFSGLFVYVASSPIIFMDIFKVSAQTYGGIFAFLSIGFIGSSQLNIFFNKLYSSESIVKVALCMQTFVGLVFFIGTGLGYFGLTATIAMLFLFMACLGMANPNAASLALAPFSKNAGSASALLGSLQIGTGALVSAAIGILGSSGKPELLSITGLMAATASLALIILFLGQRQIVEEIEPDPETLTNSH